MSKPSRNRLQEFRKGIIPTLSELKFTLRRIRKSPLSVIGIAIIAFYIALAVLADVIAPPVGTMGARDPYMIWNDGFSPIPKPPGSPVLDPDATAAGWGTHILGVMEGGYDIFYGVVWGARTAFRVGVLVIAIALSIGILLGSVSGYYGGIIDELMMRFTDIVLAFPGLILAMALVIALPYTWTIDIGYVGVLIAIMVVPLVAGHFLKVEGRWLLLLAVVGLVVFLTLMSTLFGGAVIVPWRVQLNSLDKVLIALAIVGWPGYTRVIRGEILRIKGEDYIEAAKAVGCSDTRVVLRHIVPNAIYPVVIMGSLDIGSMVLTAAALSFLGIGAPVGYADWGQMIARARNWIFSNPQNPWSYWYVFVIPGVFIFIFVLGWNLLGDAFRDILDPTLRRK
jgi:peptide/nickel transport system permease protein